MRWILVKYFIKKIQQWSYASLQIISKMSMSFSHLLLHTISLSVYLVHTITKKWDIKFINDMRSLDYFSYFGYPRVKNFTRALPADKILYPYAYPQVKFHSHILTCRVGYPWVPAPAGKIDIPVPEVLRAFSPTQDKTASFYMQVSNLGSAASSSAIDYYGIDRNIC